MPLPLEVVDDGRGVLRIGHGVVTGEELIDGARELADLVQRVPPGARPEWGIIDFSAAVDIQVDTAALHRLIDLNERTAAYAPNVHVAIVAPQEQQYVIALQWQMLARRVGWHSEIVATHAEAEAWLQPVRQRLPAVVTS
jgi:hypothetical protein